MDMLQVSVELPCDIFSALRELQVKGGQALSALMPSILDRAFKEM
jgi:hypothetical protein